MAVVGLSTRRNGYFRFGSKKKPKRSAKRSCCLEEAWGIIRGFRELGVDVLICGRNFAGLSRRLSNPGFEDARHGYRSKQRHFWELCVLCRFFQRHGWGIYYEGDDLSNFSFVNKTIFGVPGPRPPKVKNLEFTCE
jgi:hypothetical protein